MNNEFYMKRAIALAKRGRGFVSPNPLVGSVIVKNNQIISEDYHRKFGGFHAERNAILKLDKDVLKGSTLYVNLEPCSHYGKTPPCTDIIISSGIEKVVIGQIDPNPLVSGKGVEILKNNGVKVVEGVCKEECKRLNEIFNKYITKHEPFVALKIAQSIDGKIATKKGFSKWITSGVSRKKVHHLRRDYDAVMVGIGTVIADDPSLTVRGIKGSSIRVVLDSNLRIPVGSNIVKTASVYKTVIVTTDKADKNKSERLESFGCNIWKVQSNKNGRVDIESFLKCTANSGISSILVEGGKEIFTAFLKSRKVDRLVLFVAPKLFGTGIDSFGDLSVYSPDSAVTFREYSWYKSGPDMMFDGRF